MLSTEQATQIGFQVIGALFGIAVVFLVARWLAYKLLRSSHRKLPEGAPPESGVEVDGTIIGGVKQDLTEQEKVVSPPPYVDGNAKGNTQDRGPERISEVAPEVMLASDYPAPKSEGPSLGRQSHHGSRASLVSVVGTQGSPQTGHSRSAAAPPIDFAREQQAAQIARTASAHSSWNDIKEPGATYQPHWRSSTEGYGRRPIGEHTFAVAGDHGSVRSACSVRSVRTNFSAPVVSYEGASATKSRDTGSLKNAGKPALPSQARWGTLNNAEPAGHSPDSTNPQVSHVSVRDSMRLLEQYQQGHGDGSSGFRGHQRQISRQSLPSSQRAVSPSDMHAKVGWQHVPLAETSQQVPYSDNYAYNGRSWPTTLPTNQAITSDARSYDKSENNRGLGYALENPGQTGDPALQGYADRGTYNRRGTIHTLQPPANDYGAFPAVESRGSWNGVQLPPGKSAQYEDDGRSRDQGHRKSVEYPNAAHGVRYQGSSPHQHRPRSIASINTLGEVTSKRPSLNTRSSTSPRGGPRGYQMAHQDGQRFESNPRLYPRHQRGAPYTQQHPVYSDGHVPVETITSNAVYPPSTGGTIDYGRSHHQQAGVLPGDSRPSQHYYDVRREQGYYH